MELIERIMEQARSNRKRIVLPEATEQRTLRAANELIDQSIVDVILLGNPVQIKDLAADWGLPHIKGATIVDPKNNPRKKAYVEKMLEIRSSKGLTAEQADKLIEDPLCLAVMMIKCGDADGEVAGAMNATGDVLRPAFQYVKTKPGVSVVSGAMIMLFKDKHWGDNGMMVWADVAVHPNPTAEELAQIAVSTAHTTRAITGMEPRVAMLSFSTKGSAKNEMVDKVVQATALAQQMAPDVLIDGELQADAAIVPGIGSSKAPGSKIAGRANVLVFPSLDVGNISYKLVQRIADAEAIGPVLQGMAAPINDLSRGCSTSDIVSLVAITACQAQLN